MFIYVMYPMLMIPNLHMLQGRRRGAEIRWPCGRTNMQPLYYPLETLLKMIMMKEDLVFLLQVGLFKR